MSLDVYLTTGPDRIEPCSHCNGTGKINHGPEEVFEANVTHNLNTMAEAAGIYKELWRPDEIGITKARELIEPLREGLAKMLEEPAKYEALNPSNGWGNYEGFLKWVRGYLEACEENPEADVRVSR